MVLAIILVIVVILAVSGEGSDTAAWDNNPDSDPEHRLGTGFPRSWKILEKLAVMEKSWNMKISQKVMESSWMS